MIANVIIHLINDLPIVVDLEAMPGPADRSVLCTNVRTVERQTTELHPRQALAVRLPDVRGLIEAPAEGSAIAEDLADESPQLASGPPVAIDEEPDEDLLARIRSV